MEGQEPFIRPLEIEFSIRSRAQGASMAPVLWVLILISGYLESRLMCELMNIPSDCHGLSTWEAYNDISSIFEKGVVIAWLCNIIEFRKYYASLTRREVGCLYLLFLCTGPIFAGIGEIPAMKTSLSSLELDLNASTIVYAVTFILIFSGFLYQLRNIWREHGSFTFWVYIGTRTLLIGFYAVFGSLLSRRYKLHLHHLYVGYLVASLGYDKNRISLLFLVIGSAVMVQGIGAYNYAPIVDS